MAAGLRQRLKEVIYATVGDRIPMRITLIIPTFSSGGAERAMSVMANHWAAQAHAITLVTVAPVDLDFYALDPKVTRVGLGLMADSHTVIDQVRNNVERVTALRREILKSQPDVVISFLDTMNVVTLVASLGLDVPVIVCEQIDPREVKIRSAWELLRRLCYPRAIAVVVVATAMMTWAERMVRKDRIRVIPNPVYVSLEGMRTCVDHRGPGRTIVAMGRLVKQKGFDFLLQAFARCKDNHPDWSLVILGEGDERNDLESMREALGLEGRVEFRGRVKEPATILRQADLFVMSSRFEGFPLALIEAMACGLPVISTDCPTGPSEIIRNGIDGLLITPNNVEVLANAMDRLMASQSERRRLGARAVEVVERFGVEQVMNMWDYLIDEVSKVQSRKSVVPSSSMGTIS